MEVNFFILMERTILIVAGEEKSFSFLFDR